MIIKITISNLSESEHIGDIEKEIEDASLNLEWIIRKKHFIHDASSLEEVERDIFKATDNLAGQLLALKIQESLDSPELKEDGSELIDACPKKMKNQGPREVKIRPFRGEPIIVKSSYYSPKKGKKKQNKGFYPCLTLLGIHEHCTPCFASEVSKLSSILSSFNETQQVLKDQGINLDIKAIRLISLRVAERTRAGLMAQKSNFRETVSGRKVVVSTDGGRIRIREDKRGPKTKKGRSRYSTQWREPKLLIIYVVKCNGEMDRCFAPFIDGTLKGPDAIFSLIKFYLSKLSIVKADKVLFVADGARWIWNRVGKLMRALGLSSHQFYELVDFYHAVEHLGKVASLRKGWKSSERKRWIKKYRSLLLKGKIDNVIEGIRQVCRGRSSKEIRCERDYFIRNYRRMSYDTISSMGLPIGSGAMESSIRRVVNLRLKGASVYWHRETAEAMLLLRSYYKAGRFDMLKNLTFSASATNFA